MRATNTSLPTTTLPGWIIETADGSPYFFLYDATDSHDEDSVMAKYEPEPAEREKLLARGDRVRLGDHSELFAPYALPVKASA
ncbi:hypothetical protein [Mycobacteroides abscessus]|uniref:hypothetical protein n=1 Tax=Mycobacteroides abscessus TaxID=36809 RepID=UPI0009279CC2|nr:hypothetical protein [Mycobacteroides abscessus]SHQ46624.1 Uncharacterised protein [Mycobacteroides abscessus subsp. abscessus]SKQ86745.1 Uncharacterised protein [Mycobacteroides abscessus subsp. massiliense]SLC47914.1 Uncharacterised protein [Mycobacteroides abscessus subsp. massiliense]